MRYSAIQSTPSVHSSAGTSLPGANTPGFGYCLPAVGEGVLGLLVGCIAHVDAHRFPGAFHAACYVYCVAPDIVYELCFADNSCYKLTRIYADADLYLNRKEFVELFNVFKKPLRKAAHFYSAVIFGIFLKLCF